MSKFETDARMLVRANYPHMIVETLRYRDLDAQGHVNNAIFSTFSESGRTHLLLAGDAPPIPSHMTYVIVRQTISFLRELNWPGQVEVGSAVKDLGRSSFTMAQALFDRGACAATFENVMVMMDLQSRKSAAIPDDMRHWLGKLALAGAQDA